MAGVEGARERGLSPDLDGARIYKHAFVFGRVPFVNFFPALEPHPLPCNHYLGPCLPLIPVCTLYSSHGAGGARGGLRTSAEPSGRRDAVCPARRL